MRASSGDLAVTILAETSGSEVTEGISCFVQACGLNNANFPLASSDSKMGFARFIQGPHTTRAAHRCGASRP